MAATVTAAIAKPFIVAVSPYAWAWDFNAWPLPGLPSVAAGSQGKAILHFYKWSALKD